MSESIAEWRLVPEEPTEEMITAGWIDKEDVSPKEIWMAMWDKAPPSPAQHAATVEACARVAYRRAASHRANDKYKRENGNDRLAARFNLNAIYQEDTAREIRALTSGAEADEPRPLSEWSDDELFRAAGLYWEFRSTKVVRELTSRGWLPWHGGDKAPVEGWVERYLRDGSILKERAEKLRWSHYPNDDPCYQNDIIAYRPVPEKANQEGGEAPSNEPQTEATLNAAYNEAPGSTPGADAGAKMEAIYALIESNLSDDLLLGRIADIIDGDRPIPANAEAPCQWCKGIGCHECRGTGDKLPSPAADASEVERLVNRFFDERNLDWTISRATAVDLVVRALAALRPAPTEEQVERAAKIACDELCRQTKGSTAAWSGASEFQKNHMRAVARAILGQPAPQTGAER